MTDFADRQNRLSLKDAVRLTGVKSHQVTRWKRGLADPAKYRAKLYGAAYAEAMADELATTAAKWTGDPESYTPAVYIEAARKVMGGIDLDPASNEHAQKLVQAGRWFDEEDDGLAQEWQGRVFLNPPYKQPAVSQFITKLCREFAAGHVTQAILLTNNNTDTRWFHESARLAAAVCFTAGRINFYKADGQITQPTNGQSFFYFGNAIDRFAATFAEIGLIMTPVLVEEAS